MAYTADDIARYTVNKCVRDLRPISNLQLQKILYFCQKGYCEATRKLLFEDDFQAWQYGPVIPSVYKTFSLNGGLKIRRMVRPGAVIDGATKDIIDPIIEANRSKDPWNLVKATHEVGSPWDLVYRHGLGNGQTIDKRLICPEYGL